MKYLKTYNEAKKKIDPYLNFETDVTNSLIDIIDNGFRVNISRGSGTNKSTYTIDIVYRGGKKIRNVINGFDWGAENADPNFTWDMVSDSISMMIGYISDLYKADFNEFSINGGFGGKRGWKRSNPSYTSLRSTLKGNNVSYNFSDFEKIVYDKKIQSISIKCLVRL